MENKKTKKIAFLGQKGGIGKSTYARTFAVVSSETKSIDWLKKDRKILLVDLNFQQRTVWKWYERRIDNEIETKFDIKVAKSYKEVLPTINNYDLVIFDLAGGTNSETLEISQIVDLIVQPTSASIDDMEPAVEEFSFLEEKGIDNKKLIFCLHKLLSEAEDKKARNYLENVDYKISDGHILAKVSYSDASSYGLAMSELQNPLCKNLKENAIYVMTKLLKRF